MKYAELLIKIGDNAPYKDAMLAGKMSVAAARQYWIEREARRLVGGDMDSRIAAAAARLEQDDCCYRHGEIIDVRPEGWDWGSRESFPRFYVVRASAEDLHALGMSWSGPEEQLRMEGLRDPWVKEGDLYYHRRKFWIPDIDDLAREDRIVDIKASSIRMRSEPVAFDAAKAVEHHSAGTYTIRASGGSYTSISNWDAGEACDLTGAGFSIARCYDDWASGLNDYWELFTDWTAPDFSNCPKIDVATGNRHDGTPESGFFVAYSGTFSVFKQRCAHSIMDGVEIQSPGNTGANVLWNIGTSVYRQTDNCLFHNLGASAQVFNYYGDNEVYRNCTWWDCGAGRYIWKGTLYNCVIFSSAAEAWGAGSGYGYIVRDAALYNTCVYQGGSASLDAAYNCTTGDYNACSDTSTPGANSIESKTLADLDFVSTTSGAEDFHIQATSDMKGAGYAYGGMASTDIDGDSWASPPSIGIDEYASGGTDNLTASGITTGAPTVGSPALGQVHALQVSGIVTGAVVIGAPTLGQVHALEASGIVTGAVVIGAPTLGQVHALEASDIVTGAVVIGAPTLGQVHALEASGIVTGAVVIGALTLGQVHALEAVGIVTGSPVLGTPSLTGTVELTASDITAGIPDLGSPTLGQIHVLEAFGIVTEAVAIGSPTLGQVHVLEAIGITCGAPVVGTPYIVGDANISDDRYFTVEAEPRIFVVSSEIRFFTV